MLAEILKNYENLDPSIIESSQEAQHVPDEKYENIVIFSVFMQFLKLKNIASKIN